MTTTGLDKRNIIKWLFAVTATTLILLVALILAVRLLDPGPSFQFLHDRKPVLRDNFSSFTVSIYSFPAELEEVCSEASAELPSLAFLDTSNAENRTHDVRFEKQDRNNTATITILSGKLSKETTAANYFYEHAPGWVSVEITQGGRTTGVAY